MHGKHVVAFVATLAALSGCASGGGGGSPSPMPSTPPPNAPLGWPVRTAEYVDLWLHGYAMLTADTTKVPMFERGYRDRMLALRRGRNVITALDANRETLQAGFLRNPGLVNGQFAIFSFASFDEVVRVSQQFIRNDGSPGTVNDPTTQLLFLTLREYYKTVSDREWLRVFVSSLQDEQSKFYLSYWNAVQTDRLPVKQAIDVAWTGTYKTKLQRFLRNERLVDGTFILSLPLDGEGRTIISTQLGNGVATAFPSTPDSAMAAIYVFTHEIVGNAAARAIDDNVTPADKRTGVADRYLPIAAVRAGAMLLQRLAPELVVGYQQYYLRSTGAAIPAGDPEAAFAATYSLPAALVDGIGKQLDLILAGI
jgi:hypothetical protein